MQCMRYGQGRDRSVFFIRVLRYNNLRDGMFNKIRERTGYDLINTKHNEDWILDVLIGHGLKSKAVREIIGRSVTEFIVVAMRIRKQSLYQA